jgi:predicted N-acyltransferase
VAEREYRIRIEDSIAGIGRAAWEGCANPALETVSGSSDNILLPNDFYRSHEALCDTVTPDVKREQTSYNPFISYDFLASLEESGSACASTGWLPQHLVLEDDGGAALGICPAYLKSHSRGEYVFDEGWADAYERAGGRYYPKLQVSVPFTPATGPRLLVRPGTQASAVRAALARGLTTLARMRKASSVHATFLTEEDAAAFAAEDFLPRTDQQFHWRNEGYASFEDFLGALASRKRKAIRRERREAVESGIEILHLTGKDITQEAWDAFFAFYMETGSRKWGRPYLNRKFYALISERMADKVLLVMARRAGRYIAGAINFIGGDTLYGRHWGAVEQHPFLHFEVCYHQAIEFAIARGLRTVEAGAQGEHKLARGYLPVTTHSAHFIADPGFREAVAAYLDRERAYVAETGAELSELGPFRRVSDEP